ncbi:MAG: NADH-quinone oxidoreductase subunit N [Gaiellales bacterium]
MIDTPSVDWFAIAPETALIAGAFLLLIVAAFARGYERGLSIILGGATLIVAGAFSVAAWGDRPVVTMADAFRVDDLTELVRITVMVLAAFAILLSVGWPRFREHGSEFTALLLLVCAGMGIVAGSTSFVTLFVGLELFSLSLYVLCAFDGKSRASLEAGFKYLVLGTIGSIVLVYGAAFLYGSTGSFMYRGVAAGLAKGDAHDTVVILGTALVLAGLLFKVGAMPFHMWVPDVYEGAPTQVTAFMSAATKLVAFVALSRIVLDALPTEHFVWSPILIIAAIATMIGGNIAALVQTNVKRMIAWSSVAAAGYALIGVIVNGSQGLRGLVFYLIAYAFVAFGAFAVISVFERDQARDKGYATLDGMRAWGYSRPFAAMAMVVFLLAFAGFPPTAGFIGKFVVSGAAVSHGYAYLAVIGAIGSVIALGYYLRVILAMYDRSRKSDVGLPASPGLGATTLVILLCLAVVLLGGILPGMLLDWSAQASAFLAMPR